MPSPRFSLYDRHIAFKILILLRFHLICLWMHYIHLAILTCKVVCRKGKGVNDHLHTAISLTQTERPHQVCLSWQCPTFDRDSPIVIRSSDWLMTGRLQTLRDCYIRTLQPSQGYGHEATWRPWERYMSASTFYHVDIFHWPRIWQRLQILWWESLSLKFKDVERKKNHCRVEDLANCVSIVSTFALNLIHKTLTAPSSSSWNIIAALLSRE